MAKKPNQNINQANQETHEKNFIVIGFKPEEAAEQKPEQNYAYYNYQEQLRIRLEIERRRAQAETYK